MATLSVTSSDVTSRTSEQFIVPRTIQGRNEAIDFVKGFLVIGMVIFHAITYFANQHAGLLAYLKFASGGFIFISGFIVAVFYAAKWKRDPSGVVVRLLTRGLKLIAIFVISNVALTALDVRKSDAIQYGLGRGRYPVFEILLPIGCLLMILPLLLWLYRYRRLLIALLLLACAAAALMRMHLSILTLLLVGGAGFLVAMLLPQDSFADRRHLVVSLPALVICVIVLPWLTSTLLGYILYISVVLKCAADLSHALPRHSFTNRIFFLLGQYVLWCYLTHIVGLKLFSWLFWPDRETPIIWLATIIIVACLLLAISSWVIQLARHRFVFVDRVYRLVLA